MLQIQNLKITMKKDLRTLVEGLTFTLRRQGGCGGRGREWEIHPAEASL